MPVIYELHMQHVLDYLNLSDKRVNRNNEFKREDAKYKDDDYGLDKSKKQQDDTDQKKKVEKNEDIRIEYTPENRENKFLKLDSKLSKKNLSISTNMQSSFDYGVLLNS